MGRNLLNIYFSFLLSALVLGLHARSHALADVQKEREENKTTSIYRLGSTILPKDKITFRTILTRSIIISNYQ